MILKHLLTGEELSSSEIDSLFALAQSHKGTKTKDLEGKQLALLFEKPSLRTRFSFTVAMRELGGDVIESLSSTRKEETPEDVARVLCGYCDAIVFRTHEDAQLERMAKVASIPIINGLSALHHPCQILADFLTLKNHFGVLSGLNLCYIGDGNNILHSLLLLAQKVGVKIHYCCPEGHAPNSVLLERCQGYTVYSTPQEAVKHADAIYTDVWTSMGFEKNEEAFVGYQVDEALMQHAKPHALFMHCMPIERGKEVSATLPDAAVSVIFQQSANRLIIQKALLLHLLKENP
jgi:ornithine carbamoyltransferase